MSVEEIKKKVGTAAADLIEDGMIVGLGTGSTAFYFIQQLALRCKQGLNIQAVASSQQSLKQAEQAGIPLASIQQIKQIDITVDGADEIDPLKRMIKGAGGALAREKIVASMSREMIVIVDQSKLVSKLGKKNLPVEIIPFAPLATQNKLEKLGYSGSWRQTPEGSPYITDNGNYLFDIHFDQPRNDPEQDHELLIHQAGVVDTGFFFGLAGRVVIGFFDGQIIVQD